MDPVLIIIKGLIEQGGIWGLIAAALFFWNVHKEQNLAKKEQKKEDEKKDQQAKIDELAKIINTLQEENKKLLKNISEIEEERVNDLKELLSEYHSTASDTLQALEKFEFFIKNQK